MICKTQTGLVDEICSLVREIHPYELPEIIALPVRQGLPAYLEWVLNETRSRE